MGKFVWSLSPYNKWDKNPQGIVVEILGVCGCDEDDCKICQARIKKRNKKIVEEQEKEAKRIANLTSKERKVLKKMAKEDLLKMYGIK